MLAEHLTRSSAPPLWGHQEAALDFCLDKPAAALFVCMGGGKSRVVIELLRQRRHKLTLIIAPKTVARNVWEGQLERFYDQPLRVLNLSDNATSAHKAARLALWLRRDDGYPGVVIVNYDTAWREPLAPLLLRTGFDFLVLDEMHRIKSPSGKASWYTRRLGVQTPYRIGLTGTPMPHKFYDIYAQYRALDPSIFGTSLVAFRLRYGKPSGYEGKDWDLRREMVEPLNRAIYSIAFRVDDSVLDLPEVLDIERVCELSASARSLYDGLKRDLIARLGAGTITPANAMVLALRLQQLTGGTLKSDDGTEHTVDTAKADLLGEILEDLDPREPVVVFCKFRADLNRVHEIAHDLKRRSAELSGSANHLDMWLHGKADILACQIQSGGLGIDLTRARYAIFYSVGFNNGDYEQARARIHRPGQKGRATYYHLIAQSTIDRRVYQALRAKQDTARAVLEGLQRENER
jgi:SNF2 family DNA or RNA helicase